MRPAEDPEALAILQYTSGSTSDPKGVMLPHRCVAANLEAVAHAIALDPEDDVAVSWLPLYHDLGLIGVLALCMHSGTDLVLAAPQDFLASPGRWMEWMSEYGGTCTAGPNFSYVLAARALRRAGDLDLSRFRLGLNGAEPVDPIGIAAFAEAAGVHGFDPAALYPAFGMAESTVAVAFQKPGAGMRIDTVDGRVLETDRYAAACDADQDAARSLVFLGTAVKGLEMRICDPVTAEVMRDREVGELEIRGTSVTPGYYRHPEATALAFHDDWLRSGDLGYLVDGDLVICGRIKDVIILGGRNVHPHDVERAVADIDGVRAGNVIAFGTEGRKGRETLVVVAESKTNDRSIEIRAAVAERVRATVGYTPEEIVLVRPGTLPKTSSGKLQRSLCRTRYLSAELEPV
ncbi:MAG: AMP-binding protein [Acidimicrobiia bacterium]|nr:AMP-binding protein [Acidimicrobiia bacterium]